ncbi:MAG: HAMP domain-containing histidine kinase [Acidimicrobiia bacterium]|nr:HAMP domain-containing histidine kinase [Acidimicrobiia bacterium]
MASLRENKFALALVAGLVLALVVGIVFSVSARSRRVAAQAEALNAAHEAVQAATIVRSQLELAVFQDALRLNGVGVDSGATTAAATKATSSLRDLSSSVAALIAAGEGSAELEGNAKAFMVAAEAVVSGLGSEEGVTSDAIDGHYDALLDELRPLRNGLASSIDANGGANRWTSAIAGFLAVFLIPAAVITAYFVLDRRRRRQHELEVTLRAERAAHTSREQFLTAVSHQLREPLWAVRGISRMLGNDEALMAQPHMNDLHTLLAGELDDMNGLMDNLLTASRLESGAIDFAVESVDVREETKAIVESLNHRGAQIYVAMDDGVVEADRRRLNQMIRNLVANALKYGGPNIEIKGHADGDTYAVIVVDDGQGVPKEAESDLFARFSQYSEGQNLGLGLSVVMSLAVGMGGTAFHSREDGLTKFGFRLPTSTESAVAAVATYEPPSIVETKSKSE